MQAAETRQPRILARVPRAAALREGLLAGLALGLLDWLAAGVGRVPIGMLGLILAWGLLCGLLAGACAALLGRRGLALGLVVLGATALHAASTYTKSIGAPLASAGSALGFVAPLILAGGAGLLAARCFVRKRGWAWPALVVAAIPGASLGWEAAPHTPLALALTCALPLVVALAWSLRLPERSAAVALPLAVCALALPTLVADARGVRRIPGLPDAARAGADAPDIALVIVDTLRWDHAFPGGAAPREGALARLAREGVRFDQAVASAAWTLPSIASLLTSQHPSRHGAVTKERRLPEDVVTLAELMHAAGYETAAFTGGAFVSPAYGLDQGFDVFEHEAEYHFLPFRGHIPLVWRLIKNRWFPLRLVLRAVSEFGGVPRLRERVADWLARRDGSRPFFLLVHTYQVHDYYIYQPAPDDPLLEERGGPPAAVGQRLLMHPSELALASQVQLDWYHDVYRRRIEYVDRELELLLASVEASAGSRGLVTVLTSDHGEGFDATRRRVHHGGRLHDDLLRVPLVLRVPGRVEAGRVVVEQVRLLDVMPTLLELAGVSTPAGLAGRSLLPLLADSEGDPERVAWSENHDTAHIVSLRTPVWKLVDGRRGEELYRLDLDPLEDHPLDAPPPDELGAPWSDRGQLLAPRSATQSHEDAATLEQLRRLGY